MTEQRRRSRNAAAEQSAEAGVTLDLQELLYRLAASWQLILCMSAAMAIVFVVCAACFITPVYEATAVLYVLNRNDSVLNFSDLQLGTALAKDYLKVFSMWEVHEEVIANLDLPYTYKEMKRMLSVVNDADTRMLDITVTSSDADEAAAIANEYAKVASAYIADTMRTEQPSIMSAALAPSAPVRPSKVRSLLFGFVFGAFFACAYVVVKLRLDDQYKTAEDIRRYAGLPTLAVVPIEPPKPQQPQGGAHEEG